MFSAKVQTAFNFSSERLAVALLDVDDTVLLGSYSHLILKLPVISYIWSEVSADLISSFFNQSRKYYWMCLKKKKKKRQLFYPFILLQFYTCLANACAVVFQGKSLPAVGRRDLSKILMSIQLYDLMDPVSWNASVDHRDVSLESNASWGWLVVIMTIVSIELWGFLYQKERMGR